MPDIYGDVSSNGESDGRQRLEVVGSIPMRHLEIFDLHLAECSIILHSIYKCLDTKFIKAAPYAGCRSKRQREHLDAEVSYVGAVCIYGQTTS